MKRWMIAVLIVVVVVAAGFFTTTYFVKSTQRWAQSLTWPNPSLEGVADGVYEGTAAVRMPAGTAAANTTATVRVTVKDHRYAAIEVVAPRPIVSRMTDFSQVVVRDQSLRPDAISGGTVTKKVVLMAAAKAIGAE